MNNNLEIISLINSKMSTSTTLVNTGTGKVNYKRKSQYNTKMQKNEIYSQMMITRTTPVHISNIGNNIKETLEKVIASEIEGKCIVEGYIKPTTVEIVTFSSGLVRGDYILFEVVFQCYVCCPVEGMHIKCIAKDINKAGIRAILNETPTPVIIFIARDHNYNVNGFSDVKVNHTIKVRVIGQRFELNDTHISIIAEFLEMGKLQEDSIAPTKNTIKSIGISNVLDEPIEVEQLPIEPIYLQPTTITEEIKKPTRTKPPPLKKRSLKIKIKI